MHVVILQVAQVPIEEAGKVPPLIVGDDAVQLAGLAATGLTLLAGAEGARHYGVPWLRRFLGARALRSRMRTVESEVNDLVCRDAVGWGRIIVEPLKLEVHDCECPYYERGTVRLPRHSAFERSVFQGLRHFVASCTIRPLRHFLLSRHRDVLDAFHTRYLVRRVVPHLLRVAPTLDVQLRGKPPELLSQVGMIGRRQLKRILLLETGDSARLLTGVTFNSDHAKAVRLQLEARLHQLAEGRDGARTWKHRKRDWEYSGFRLLNFCDRRVSDLKADDIVKPAEQHLGKEFNVYVLYPTFEGRDRIREDLQSTHLWNDHYRDAWYEPGPDGLSKGRLSFVPDKAVVMAG